MRSGLDGAREEARRVVKVAVMGTGAMGGYLGARLGTAAGVCVTFIARGAHLAAIRTTGLRVWSPLGDVHVTPASATDDPGAVGPVDVVLLGVKLYDIEVAVKALRPLLGADTAVVCLQNGIDAPTIVARLHGEHHAVGSVVMINAELVGPGVIKHNALNQLTVGELDGRASGRLEHLVALANAAGVETVLSRDIRLELWRKLLLMAPMGALSAMTRVPLRRIREEADTWRLAEQGMREVVAVANAEGVRLDAADVDRTLAFVKGMSPAWKGSLTFDLEQGRRLEVDWLSGAVCRRGEAAGIDTPFHRVALGVLKPHAGGAAHVWPEGEGLTGPATGSLSLESPANDRARLRGLAAKGEASVYEGDRTTRRLKAKQKDWTVLPMGSPVGSKIAPGSTSADGVQWNASSPRS